MQIERNVRMNQNNTKPDGRKWRKTRKNYTKEKNEEQRAKNTRKSGLFT